ncbi:hypothetical protein OG209_05225 [Streptomyces sp. NBC_01383]|uniref:hypothetical protein n=1 Tax=Streptomyces sp. NBC_01383 TaxID=2903846 RepID=UPI003255E7BA
MTDIAICAAHPSYGTARCELPPGHAGAHRAPLAIGGHLTWNRWWRDRYDNIAPENCDPGDTVTTAPYCTTQEPPR